MCLLEWMDSDININPHLDELYNILVFSLRWSMVVSTGREFVFGVVDDWFIEEVRQDGEQAPPVPVVGDTTSVVTLSCHVGDGVKWNIFILVDVHL